LLSDDEDWNGYSMGAWGGYYSGSSYKPEPKNIILRFPEVTMETTKRMRRTCFIVQATEEQIDDLTNKLMDAATDFDATGRSEFFNGTYERMGNNTVEIYAEDTMNVQPLADLICKWQLDVKFPEAVFFEYAEYSQFNAEPGDFCGGVVVCYKGRSRQTTTYEWALSQIEEMVAV
jgi:hypothetical protein